MLFGGIGMLIKRFRGAAVLYSVLFISMFTNLDFIFVHFLKLGFCTLSNGARHRETDVVRYVIFNRSAQADRIDDN